MKRTITQHVEHELEQGIPGKKGLDELLLDIDNPRLASGAGGTSQEELLSILWREMAVDEVAFSIAANGFFPSEPLFVVPGDPKKPAQKDKFLVVEGNRRLAAVLLLVDKKLRTKLKATDLPEISEERRTPLRELPVVVYTDRRSLWQYCGFRHINGAQPWDAFSKAKYVAMVFERYNESLDDIARRIGDRHTTVKRLYRGYKVLQQAETQVGFDKEDRFSNRFYFSHLYTALDQPDFQKHLGITPEGSLKPNPVPKSKLDELSELMTWIYGRKSTTTEPLIRRQNPDLNNLRVVLGKPAALSLLRAGYSLDRAFEFSLGDQRRFREALTSAKEELQQAKATVTKGYQGEEDLFELAGDIVLYAGELQNEMKEKTKTSKHKA